MMMMMMMQGPNGILCNTYKSPKLEGFDAPRRSSKENNVT